MNIFIKMKTKLFELLLLLEIKTLSKDMIRPPENYKNDSISIFMFCSTTILLQMIIISLISPI